jgi:hypothetical protein
VFVSAYRTQPLGEDESNRTRIGHLVKTGIRYEKDSYGYREDDRWCNEPFADQLDIKSVSSDTCMA